jgi:cytoskeletal protein RodZ
MKNKTETTAKTVIEKAEGFLKEEKRMMADDEIELPDEDFEVKPRASTPQPLADGLSIKRTREAKGLTLEMVHESTKIPMDSLRAIEEGYTVRTLSPFYYRGFVKIYCQYLGISIETVLSKTAAPLTKKKKDSAPRIQTSKEAPARFQKPDKSFIVDDFNFSRWAKDFFTPRRKQQIIAIAGLLLALFLFIKFITFVGSWISERSKNRRLTRANEVIKPVESKKKKQDASDKGKTESTRKNEIVSDANAVEEIPVVVTQESSQEAEAAQPASNDMVREKDIKLTVRAKKNSWLRVKTDGQTVFQSTLKQGTVETWNANENIEISGKNLNQLEVELNGKMVGTLGRDNNQANTVMINKKGLTVVK